MSRRPIATCLFLIVAAAVYFVLVELHRPAVPAQDVYAFFVPNMVHAVHAVLDGGRGLLWNPFQSCGEPFFANSVTGLLYPPHLLFLVLDPNNAVHAVLVFNMTLGATGMLLLARELGLSWPAALAGAFAFELGDPMGQLTSWSPMHNGSWTWVPWALLFCERLLRAPNRRDVAGLGVALALSMLPGFVLVTVFTYQLIALRVGWELLTAKSPHARKSTLAIVAGLALAPLLTAVQLLPAAELTRESQRSVLTTDFLTANGNTGIYRVITSVTLRIPPVPFMAAALLLASVAMIGRGTRRLVAFYLATGAVYAVLGLGSATPLFSWYLTLPMSAATLRIPYRFFWVTGFCLALLTAFGVEAVLRAGAGPSRRRWVLPAIAAAIAVGLFVFVPGGLRWPEAVALTVIVLAVAAAAWRPWLGPAAAWIIVAAVALDLAGVTLRWPGRLLPSTSVLWDQAETFAALRPSLTEQQRVYISPGAAAAVQLTLSQKTATVMRIPDTYDYDALLGRRIVGYISMLWQGVPFDRIADLSHRETTAGFRHRLLDLAAVRYLIVTGTTADLEQMLGLRASRIKTGALRVYQNDTTLPRARWVPRAEVIADARTLLDRLASDTDDPTSIALIEEAPPSGFTGEEGSPPGGSVRFVRNDPEHVILDVDAPARGFLVLADQYYPGWRATVDGASAPIVRANYVFRLVEVPAGRSRVEFLYRPLSVAIGAALSAVGVAVVAVLISRQ